MSQPDNRIEVATAFLVVVQRHGDIAVFSDNFPEIGVDRVATLNDVETYCTAAARDAGRLIEREMREASAEKSTSERVRRAVAKRKSS